MGGAATRPDDLRPEDSAHYWHPLLPEHWNREIATPSFPEDAGIDTLARACGFCGAWPGDPCRHPESGWEWPPGAYHLGRRDVLARYERLGLGVGVG